MIRVLLLIPTVWFFSVLVFTYDGGFRKRSDLSGSASSDEISENRVAAEDNRHGSANDEKFDKVKVIQGFGPPMVFDQPSAETETPSSAPKISDMIEKVHKGGLHVSESEKFEIDWNSSIYRHDPDQPGENGRPVVINKQVRAFLLRVLRD